MKTSGSVEPHRVLQRNTKLLVAFAVLVAIIVIDISILRLYDSVNKNFLPLDSKEVLFAITSVSCMIAGVVLLEFVKPQSIQDQLTKKVPILQIYRSTKVVQYALGILLAYILFEILIGSSYNTYALLTAIVCSYVLSIGILAIFVARMTDLACF